MLSTPEHPCPAATVLTQDRKWREERSPETNNKASIAYRHNIQALQTAFHVKRYSGRCQWRKNPTKNSTCPTQHLGLRGSYHTGMRTSSWSCGCAEREGGR